MWSKRDLNLERVTCCISQVRDILEKVARTMRMRVDKKWTGIVVCDWSAVTFGCFAPARWSDKIPVNNFVRLKCSNSAGEAFCLGDWNFAASS